MKGNIILIVAMSENGVIGVQNRLPWHLPDDLRHFKNLTIGKPILMGRKTFESLGRPLRDRENRVLTRNQAVDYPGCRVFHELTPALEVSENQDLMVIGGEELFVQTLPYADRIYLTRVAVELKGDAYFPSVNKDWKIVDHVHHPADERHRYAFDFETLERASV